MSAVYFHTPDETVLLSGRERAWAGGTCTRITMAMLSDYRAKERYSRLLSEDHYLHSVDDAHWLASFKTAWSGLGISRLASPGEPEPFSVDLNTALALGSDPVKLLARIHGQCEVHGFIPGTDREFIASVIDEGRGTGVLRPNQGWEDVATLLRRSSYGSVVMSYSVTDSWPNLWCSAWPGNDEIAQLEEAGDWRAVEAAQEAWYSLPDHKQWAYGTEWLQHPDRWGHAITEATWQTWRAHPGQTIFDIEQWLDSDSAPSLESTA